MATRITISRRTFNPGSYNQEILAPARASSARLTLTRQPSGWPAGELFTFRIYERERGTQNLNLLTSATESGGPATGKDGTVNPPLVITLTWPVDKDRDIIRFEFDVVQAFDTALTLEFL